MRSENEYVGIDRNLSYRDHDEQVELVDYTRQPPGVQAPQRGGGAPSSRSSSSARPDSRLHVEAPRRPVSEASTVVVEPTFHVPPPPGPSPKPTEAPAAPVVTVQQWQESEDHVTSEAKPPSPPDDAAAELETMEEQLLLAAGSGSENRGLKISRRHSVEVEKKPPKSRKPAAADETPRTASFSGSHVHRADGKKSGGGAYSVTQGKELQSKEWEVALQREFDDEVEREKESVRARERRREMEQRERRRARDHVSSEHRAEARKDREREREAAKERRLVRDPRGQSKSGTSTPEVIESPESFL